MKLYRSNGNRFLISVTSRGQHAWVCGDIALYDLWCAITNQV